MYPILIENQDDITEELVYYISNKAWLSSMESEISIRYSIDSEVFNPKIQEYLESSEFEQEVGDIEEGFIFPAKVNFAINFSQELKLKSYGKRLSMRFKRLLKKLKRFICELINSSNDLNIEGLIGELLGKIVKSFVKGFASVFLPLIVNILGLLINRGINFFCETDWEVEGK